MLHFLQEDVDMFTLDDEKQLHRLMNENSDNYILIQKLLDFQQLTISKISHEIRNPLTLISSALQLIQKQHPEVIHFSYWKQMLGDISFMKTLLEELSSFNNGSRLHKTTIHSTDFFKRLILSFATTLSDGSIELTSQIEQNLPDMSGDPIKLQEALLNLLSNAKDAVNSNGKIFFSAQYKDNSIILNIKDNGCGIPQNHLSEIFTPFTTYKENGTGLGLAIVKAVTEAHHGTIHVQSVPFHSTAFTLTLPIQDKCK